jgi:hypothetical protein
MARIYLALVSAVLFLTCQEASAQICKPVAERSGEVGCWIIAHQSVGQFNKPETFWHLDVYATRAEAEAAKTAGSVVVESLGKMWLLTIADKGWRPPGGERIAEIGLRRSNLFRSVHGSDLYAGHDGAGGHARCPEAWYTQAGETCLETPNSKQIGLAGGPKEVRRHS